MVFNFGELFYEPGGVAWGVAYANLIAVKIVAIVCKCRWICNGESSLIYNISR